MSDDTITGTTIAGRYLITGYLRQGRMGDIYVARTTDTNERVAVKLLDPGLFHEPEAVRRFERENQVTRDIDHPSSLRVLDYGRDAIGPYLITEYVTGEILSDVIEETGAMDVDRVARIAAQVAMALGAAHAVHVVHRDLAPTNILLAEQDGARDIVKVLDLGLSRLTETDAEDSTLTAVGVRIGTPYYMAPEYIEEYTLDYRADFYGLGVVIFEMLTGDPVFTGRPYKVMDQHVNAPPPKPSTLVPNVPGWLDELVLWLLAKAPDDRPSDAAQIVQAIEKGLGEAVEVVQFAAPPPTPAAAEPRAAAPSRAPTGTDPILERFMDGHILELHKSKGDPPSARKCMRVTHVAKTCLASRVGVRTGMLLELPDEPEGEMLDPDLYRKVVNKRHYRFTDPNNGDVIHLRSSGIELGIELVRTPEHVQATYNPLRPEPSALLDLWKQQAWDRLEKLSWRTLTQQAGASGVLNTGLFARFLGSGKPKIRDHPALLFHGAARHEQGHASEGREFITEFNVKHAQHWGTVYGAVANSYIARDKLESGATDLAIDLLVQAYQAAPLPQIGTQIEKIAGRLPNIAPWVGNALSDYSLDTVDRRQSAKLYDTLTAMDDDHLLVVCLLGGFRGSREYDLFMRRYLNYTAWFNTWLAGLHVVTTQRERDPRKPEHYIGEDQCIQAGVPFMVLEDYRAFVQRAIKPAAIPTIYLVDKTATVVHEGRLLPHELWEALALAGMWRLQRLKQTQ